MTGRALVSERVDAEGLNAALRDAGMRATRGRRSVYLVLRRLGGHRSADEVHEALVARGETISRASVFSSLDTLRRIGLVMAADVGPGRALYEAGDRWHHHAVCRVCGQVSDVDCVIGRKPCLTASGDWGEVDEAQVIFRGVCHRCLAQSRERHPRRSTGTLAKKAQVKKSQRDRRRSI